MAVAGALAQQDQIAFRLETATRMFEVGRVYRRRDLHDRYGGQRQGGISTPADRPLVFLITGESGGRYGYDDFWDDDGVFHYYGEGQRGDMEFRAGNAAILDHAANGEELHLFEQDRPGYLRYRGEVACAGYEHVADAPDIEGALRTAIVFHLVPLGNAASDIADSPEGFFPSRSNEDMRAAALEGPTSDEPPSEAKRRVYRRSAALRAYVLQRARGYCESCGERAPFQTTEGRPYLEAHHTRRRSDGGPDHPRWVGAVCPTCHARIHHALDGEQHNERLIEKLGSLEAA